MARRGAGEGSIYRQADGLWAATIELPRDPRTGRRRRKVVRAKTKRSALDRRDSVRATLTLGLPVPDGRTTTEAYLHGWLSDILPGTVRESTATGYGWLMRRYVIPAVGGIVLSALSPADVNQMLRHMEAEGLSSRTRRQVRTVLRRALRDAERWGYVARNVAALVDAPPADGMQIEDALTADEARALLGAARGDRLEALAELVLAIGLRKGEAMALLWTNTDLDHGTVTVSGTLKRVRGGWHVDRPKTTAGTRTVPLPGRVAAALREHRRQQVSERLAAGPDWQDHGFVFTTSIGTPLEPRNMTRWWHGLCEHAGVPRRRFHASRHTAATLMLAEGVPLEVISKTLGHASMALTADVYAKVGHVAQRQAADAMDALYGQV